MVVVKQWVPSKRKLTKRLLPKLELHMIRLFRIHKLAHFSAIRTYLLIQASTVTLVYETVFIRLKKVFKEQNLDSLICQRERRLPKKPGTGFRLNLKNLYVCTALIFRD